MNNILYILSHFIILPLGFIFLIFFNKSRIQLLVWGFLLISFYTFLNLMLYVNIGIEQNLDPAITGVVIIIMFLIIIIKMSDIENNFDSYNYLRKVILYGFGLYFLIEHIPLLRGIVTLIIALISVALANIIGFNCSIAGIDYADYNLFWQYKIDIISGNIIEVNIPINPTDISIVLGCTGIREILLLYFIIMHTSAETSLKRRTFFITMSVILIANILRNTIVLYYTGYKNLPFEFTHHTIGTILIFFSLLFVVIFTLFKVPEINSHIENIFNLKKISPKA